MSATLPLLFALGFAASVGTVAAVIFSMLRPAPPDSAASAADALLYEAEDEGRPLLQRAIDLTAGVAARRGLLSGLESQLRNADVPLRSAELFFGHMVATGVLMVATWVATRNLVLTALVVGVACATPPLFLKTYAKRRRARFVSQLPETLSGLAGALRAGRSLMQAMDTVSKDGPEPMGRELRKVVAEVRLGRAPADAFSEAGLRVGSKDFEWVVLTMRLQAEVGGNLAELFDQVAATIRGRARLKAEVKALTAEGRASALMLIVMPPGLGAAMYGMNPEYMKPLFTEGAGQVMLGLSTAMIIGGWFWMKKVITISG